MSYDDWDSRDYFEYVGGPWDGLCYCYLFVGRVTEGK